MTPNRHLSSPFLLCVVILVAIMAAVAPVADAAKGVDSTIGTKSGSPALGGTFDQPQGVAVRQSTGQVYVADQENHRIQRFRIDDNGTPGVPGDDVHVFELAWGWDVVQPGGDGDSADGSFEVCTVASQCQAGVPGGGGGQFGDASQFIALAVDQSTGEVYATDVRNRRVSKFSSDGEFLRAWGYEVVASGPGNTGGPEICVPAAGDVCQAGGGGSEAGAFSSQLFSIEVDSVGNVYVADGSAARVQKFTSAGVPLRLWGYDVVASGPGNIADDNEQQQVAVTASGGTFTLAFEGETTSAIQFNAASELVEDRLKALPTIQHQDQLQVTGPAGGPWTVTFTGGLTHANQPEMVADGSALAGVGASASVTTVVKGAEFEICVPANGDTCKAGAAAGGGEGSRYLGSSRLGRFSRLFFLALDGADRVYVSDPDSGRIQRFQADGSSPDAFAVAPPDPGFDRFVSSSDGIETDYRQLTIDRSDDHVYALKGTGADKELQIVEIAPSGDVVETHAVGAGLASTPGSAVELQKAIALHESSGRLYLTSWQGDHWVIVLDDDGGFQAGSATVKPATDVTIDSATLNALVNPNGFATSYQFEYSLDGETWTKVGTPQSAGEGTADVPVSAAIVDLQANSEYSFRVAVATTFAGSSVSDEETFTTALAPPTAQTLYPAARTATEVVLTGAIDANNVETDYFFEWGETASYGEKTAVRQASGGATQVVNEILTGLQPNTIYHYRLIAENGQGDATGDDVEFTTRSPLPSIQRGFEMVTPPFKVTRGTVANGVLGANRLIAGPSLDGETVRWKLHFFPLLEETRSPFNGDDLIMRRSPSGWTIASLFTLPLLPEFPANLVDGIQLGASGDLETQAWMIGARAKQGALLPNASDTPLNFYTRRDGTGVEGWTGWLSDVEAQQLPLPATQSDTALFNDDGSWMVRWGDYRQVIGLAPGADASATQFAGLDGGRTPYRQQAPPEGPIDLVSGCTGSDPSATLVPSRIGTGAASDTIGTRACTEGSVVSRRGAIVGANHVGAGHGGGEFELIGPSATALANDGSRVYFTSPDPSAPTTPKACATSTTLPAAAPALAADTSCPPQLYLRHYDADGDPTVRWISRPAADMPSQQIGLLGPTVFQGASRDGDTVYFKTNSPLTPDDPNGTGSAGPITTGVASDASWDLYRYEVPADPINEAGTLTRITGGPTGTADPSTNGSMGGAARFISDDGERVYFVTNGVLPGVGGTGPKGAATVAGGSPSNTSTRNLYLFDDNEAGADRWRFIAQLPLGTTQDGPRSYDACASYYSVPSWDSGAKAGTGSDVFDLEGIGAGSCVRGTADGEAIAFITQGRLTQGDLDDVADVYLFDAGEDELVRVTAPRLGSSTYGCRQDRKNGEIITVVACRGQFVSWMKHSGLSQTGEFDRGWGGDRYSNIAQDASGAISLFFESRAQLLPGDHNVNHWDVYQWREGELSLISTGEPGHHSYFSGNGIDGRDVFIATSARIDPRELDDGDYDIYDARIGGGFPYTPPEKPCDVLAFECENKATPPPPTGSPASPGFNGQGNVRPKTPKCAKGKVRRRSRCINKPRKGRSAAKNRKGGRR